jgi:Sulfotransferase domain
MKVISLGVGRTGTFSLKLALEQLGFGPCHHMAEVRQHVRTQVPLWTAAVRGHADWRAIFAGYQSASDWPTAGFARELVAHYPNAKFILTVRTPESWAQSFAETIHRFLAERERARPEMLPWLDMVVGVLHRTGFVDGLDVAGLRKAFVAHNEAVKALLPPKQLLVYEVKQGWAPLCEYLDVRVPDGEFPRTNDRSEFWERVSPALA